MSEQILEQLFDSPLKVKLLRLFLRNPEKSFLLKEITKRVKSDIRSCRHQIEKLKSINLLGSRYRAKKRIYFINPRFDFYGELRTLVLKSNPASKEKLIKRLRNLGRIKLAVLSGVFLNAENPRVDLLVVGDLIKKRKLDNFLKDLEEKPIIAVIFGSYASGTYAKNSDIDILFVFQKVEDSKKIENTAKKISMKTNTQLNPIYLSYQEFKESFHNPTKAFFKKLRKDKIILLGIEWWRQLEDEEA